MRRFGDIDWVKLKHKCPYNITLIAELAENIISVIRSVDIEDDEINEIRDKIFSIRPTVTRILLAFLDVARKNVDKDEKKEWVVYDKMERDIRAVLNMMDDFEDNKMTAHSNDVNRGAIIKYMNIIESVVSGVVYDSLYEATRLEPKDKTAFLYALWCTVSRRSGILTKPIVSPEGKSLGVETINYKEYMEGNKGETLEKEFKNLEKSSKIWSMLKS